MGDLAHNSHVCFADVMPLDQQAIESKHPKSKMELERSGSNQAEEIETEIAVEAGQVRPLRCPEYATIQTAPESGKGTMELTRSNDRFRLTWNATLRRIPTPLNTDLAGHTVLHGPDELQSRIADCLEATSEEEQMLFDEKVFEGQDLIQSKTNKRQKELGAWEAHKKKACRNGAAARVSCGGGSRRGIHGHRSELGILPMPRVELKAFREWTSRPKPTPWRGRNSRAEHTPSRARTSWRGVTSRGDPRPARGVTRRGDPTAAATRQ